MSVHGFAKPWYRMRSLHMFRDETSLAANPALWPSIESALGLSRRLARELRGHTHGLTTARFSPDGQLAATASQDTTARVWRVSDGQAIATLRGHRDMVMGAWFSPDNGRVLTAGSDGTARIFDMSQAGSTDSLLDLARRRQTRQLTPEERERFMH